MKKFFGKNFVIFLSLIVASCATQDDQQSKIRIVDLQGKSHPVITRVPELNSQALVAQGKLQENKNNAQNVAPAQQNLAQNTPDYGVVAPESTSKAFRASAEKKLEDPLAAPGIQEQAVEYDLSDPAEAKDAKKSASKKPAKKVVASKSKTSAKAAATSKSGRFSVQVGSFASSANADQTLAAMKKFHAGKVETVAGEKTIYRVLLGPFATRKQANDVVRKITNSGHEAILVRNK